MSATVTVRFIPQAWVRDQAVEVDPEGATTFEVPVTDANDTEGTWLPDHDDASDALREHENAPAWIGSWSGPFEVKIEHDNQNPACLRAGTNSKETRVPQATPHAAAPQVIRTRLQRLGELVELQADSDWGRSYVQEILDQDPDATDLQCPRFAGLVEESGDGAIVLAETIADLADEMAARVTNEIPMSAIEMIDLDTQEHRQAYTEATVHFIVAGQSYHRA
jgi:hypothetical protein